jgi:hypothetical protein
MSGYLNIAQECDLLQKVSFTVSTMKESITSLTYNAEIWILQRETMTKSNQENKFFRHIKEKDDGTDNF